MKYHEMVINSIKELDLFFRLSDGEKLVAYSYARNIGWQSARPSTVAITIIKMTRPQMKFKELRKYCHVNVQTLKPWLFKFCMKMKFNERDMGRILELESDK